MTYEGFRLKVLKYWRKGLANMRQKKLKGTDFTIILTTAGAVWFMKAIIFPKKARRSACFSLQMIIFAF